MTGVIQHRKYRDYLAGNIAEMSGTRYKINSMAFHMRLILVLLSAWLVLSAARPGTTASTTELYQANLKYSKLVDSFYLQKQQPLFWFAGAEATELRVKLKSMLDSAVYWGLNKAQYHYQEITANAEKALKTDSSHITATDRIFTDALLSLAMDVYRGFASSRQIGFDEISGKYQASDNATILKRVVAITKAAEIETILTSLEPQSKDYLAVKDELRGKLLAGDEKAAKQLAVTSNILRWVSHFGLRKYVLINPASALLRYYQEDTLALFMKIVVGTTDNPTPRFAAWCTEVILYPYWHVPYTIAVNELLPSIKRNPGYLDSRNLQVLDSKGKVLDPYSVNWSNLSAGNFPYQLRQSTGCDNALGVIKFQLTDPYQVYMHDTNNKLAFMAGARYFSHGCIRLEKPVELANLFLPGRIDNEFLESCVRNQKPTTLKLPEPVPVFVVYMTAEPLIDGKMKYYRDIYKLMR